MTSLPPLIYFEFTSDSLFIFRFDLDVCYTSNHLTCIDAGNNQLLISSLVPANYYLSSDGELMAIDIVGLGIWSWKEQPMITVDGLNVIIGNAIPKWAIVWK